MNETSQHLIFPPDSNPHPNVSWMLWASIGIVVFILIVGVIVIFAFRDSGSESSLKEGYDAKEEKDVSERSLSTLTDSECESAADAEAGFVCYAQRAVEKQEVRYCQHLPKEFQETCETQVYKSNTKLKNDPSLCEKIKQESERDNCYSEIAIIMNDHSVCEKIKERKKTDIGKGERSAYDECFDKIARATNNSELCSSIIGDNGRNTCYTVIATTIGDSRICDNLSGEYAEQLRPQCYGLIARNKGDSSACDSIDSIASRNYCKDQAYLSEALNAKNVTPCHNVGSGREILDKNYKIPEGTRTFGGVEYCYEEVMRTTKRATVCGDIINDMKRKSCYIYISQLTNDPSQCNAASVTDGKGECYKKAIPNNSSSASCEIIKEIEIRDDCYYYVAYYNKDKSYCSSINDSGKKDWCIKNVP